MDMASGRPEVPQRKPRNKNVKRNAKLFASNSSGWTGSTGIPPPYVDPITTFDESEFYSSTEFMVEGPPTPPSFDMERDFERELEQDFEREMWRRMGIAMPCEQQKVPPLAMQAADPFGLDSSNTADSGFDHFSRLVICQARVGFQPSMLTEENLAMHNLNHAADPPCLMNSKLHNDSPNSKFLTDFCLLARQIPTLKVLCSKFTRELSHHIIGFLGEVTCEEPIATLASEDAPAGEHVSNGKLQDTASSVSTPSKTASNVSSCKYLDEMLSSRTH